MRRTVSRSGARYGSWLNARLSTAVRYAGSASASRGPGAAPAPRAGARRPPARPAPRGQGGGDQSARGTNLIGGQQAAQEHVPVRGEPRPQRGRVTGQAAGVRQLIHPVTLTSLPGNLAGASWEESRESESSSV